MVFEAIVAEVLNKFLGQYVENLDSSQLKIGIWGGDVVLKDLEIKPTALDELDLPFRPAYARLGKLVLKIPWKKLYTAPVEAVIEGLYILAVPQFEIKYDAVKEEKYLNDIKQAELRRVERVKKLEREKDKPKAPDTFAEKLVTQIIKNVQAKISDIHIRFEDDYSHPDVPFAVGVTLHNISVLSTDENWKECISTDTVSAMIYKVLNLESLAVYWNCKVPFFSRGNPKEVHRQLAESICTKDNVPADFKYILGPINLESQMQINPKPEIDEVPFTIPKLRLGVTLQKLSVALSKEQFQSLIIFIESIDHMTRAATFRKFRPSVPVMGHCKDWWQFALKCVIESQVRRLFLNWDWNHMKEHRAVCREYAEAYKAKLMTKKPSSAVEATITKCEKILDVFNIVIVRQKVEMEVERESVKTEEKKRWWRGWFSSPAPAEEDSLSPGAIVKRLENAMGPEEKKKLYQAIDYQEHAVPTQYPKSFVELALNFELKGLVVEVRDDAYDDPRILCAELWNVMCHFEQRPSAKALKVVAAVDSFGVYGMRQGETTPCMVSFRPLKPGVRLLDVLFETNPMDGSCDQRLQVTSRPLEIVYDAATVNKLVDVFRTPRSLAIQQLQAAAESKLSDFKEMSATGLQYAIEQHSILDINIDIGASYCIVPYSGLYLKNQDLLIVNLGHLNVMSVTQDRSAMANVRDMYQKGYSEDEILEAMGTQSYDKFMLRLQEIQILLVLASEGELWEDALASRERTPMHVLEPTSVEVLLLHCLIRDDPRLPKFKVEGLLPALFINLEDDRVLHLASLGTSIPFPTDEDDEMDVPVLHGSLSRATSFASGLSRVLGDVTREHKNICPICRTDNCRHKRKETKSDEFVQFVDLKLEFVLRDLHISIFKKSPITGVASCERLLDFKVYRLVVQVVQRTFDVAVHIQVGSIDLIFNDIKSQIGMINTPMMEGEDKYMFLFKYMLVDKKSPDFHSKYGSVIQMIEAYVVGMTLLLHQEALLVLWEFGATLYDQLEGVLGPRFRHVPSAQALPAVKAALTTIQEEEDGEVTVPRRAPKRSRPVTEAIDFKVVSKIFSFRIELLNRRHSLAQFSLEGGFFDVIVKKSYTEILIKLKNVAVFDPNPVTKHNQIMSVMGEEALSVQVVLFNIDELAGKNPDTVDMTIITKTSAIRLVYVNSFVTTILNFIHSFKTMKEILEQAAKDAAEAALQNVQDAYVKATRIALSIQLQAPVIVIPASNKSLQALYFDLGTLVVKNTFETLNIVNEMGQNAIIDEILVDLTEVKISRVVLERDGQTMQQEHKLLKPISCTLLVKRNISCSWYTNVPYVDCSGRLQSIAVNLSEEDFAMIKRIPLENMTEGEFLPTEPNEPSVLPDLHVRSFVRPQSLDVNRKSSGVAPSYKDLTPTTGAVATMVKFTFTMDSFIIDLFSGGSADQQQNGLARFSFNILSLKGLMYSDGTMSTSALLVDCLLDDTRVKHNTRLTRLMQRKSDLPGDATERPHGTDDPFRSMVDITFQKKGTDMFIDVRVFGFDLVVSTEYLMRIADFFVGWSYIPEEESGVGSGASIKAQASAATMRSSSSSSRVVPKSTAVAEPVNQSDGMMIINVRVEKPDIIMVETMDDINTKALVLNSELTLKLRMSHAHQAICGSVKDLQLYSCMYNPKKRDETTHQILRPCCISIAGSTPGGEGMHLDICLTPLRLSVSPATIELLYNVQKGLVIPESRKEEVVVEDVDYTELWQPKSFKQDEYWYFKTELGVEPMNIDWEQELAGTEKFHEELCIVSAPSILVTMEVGLGAQTLPVILIEMSLHTAASNWSSQMTVDSCMSMEVKYYNSALALWEPMVEPVEVEKDGVRTHMPWELRMEVVMNCVDEKVQSPASVTTSLCEEVEELPMQPPIMAINISSNENLEVTITKTCLDLLITLSNTFQTAIHGQLGRAEIVAPFTVKNDTGLAIAVMLEDSYFHVLTLNLDGPSKGADYREVMLESGAKVELILIDPEADEILDDSPKVDETLRIKNMKVKECLWVGVFSTNLQLNSDRDEVFHLHDMIKGEGRAALKNLIYIYVIERNCILTLPVIRAEKRYFSLKHRGEGNDPWGLISDVQVKDGGTIITLRSIIQVHNHFDVPVSVYYMTKRGNEVECIGTVHPDSQLNLPLHAVYTPTNELFFSVEGYTVSIVPFVWKDLQNMLSAKKVLQCEPKNRKRKAEPFFMKIVGEMQQVFFEGTARHTMLSTCYNIHLRPTVVLKNHLPVVIVVCLADTTMEVELPPGERIQLPTAEPGACALVLRIPDYLEKEWTCRCNLESEPNTFTVWTFHSYDSVRKVCLDLGMRTVQKTGCMVMTLYCPYWMLNKTGLLLTYRKSRKSGNDGTGSPRKLSDETANLLYHPEDFKGPVLFSFKAKSFFGKKKACLKVEDSDWSDKFPLDVAGSSGVVSCKHADMVYKIGVYIQLTYSSLTKQVTFTPYYVLINNAAFAIEVQEAERPADPWIRVLPNDCMALWPHCHETRHLRARVVDTKEITKPFAYDSVYTTLLRLDNRFGGLNVDIQIAEGSVYISFMSYEPGLAPALIFNHTDVPISMHEEDESTTVILDPGQCLMFTWSKPVGSRRLVWANNKKKNIIDELRRRQRELTPEPAGEQGESHRPLHSPFFHRHLIRGKSRVKPRSEVVGARNKCAALKKKIRDFLRRKRGDDLDKDGIDEFVPYGSEKPAYWVSFLDGMQRVLLFTYDANIARDALSAGELERIDQEITISIHGVGVSFVNNISGIEMIYCGLASSGIIWETCKMNNRRFKALCMRDTKLVEEAYVQYKQALLLGEGLGPKWLAENKFEVDFELGEILKPNRRRLRRTYRTGLWFQMKTSKHQMQLHAKVNRLQVDNQMYDCLFPVILAPVPLPRSIAADSEPKPFLELSIVRRLLEHSPVVQYKYFKVLVQEFHVKLDIGFINALLQFFEAEEISDEDEKARFLEDQKLVNEPLMSHALVESTAEQKNFYDLLHFSPLKIHLSFSLSSASGGVSPMETPAFITVIMQSLGVTLTDVQDVVFKLAYFERKYTFLTQRQLMSEVKTHYIGQALKQLYVLVLGLDVLGNPFGLVLGVARGVEDLFYEPFQGAIQGPEEFAEGLVLGMRSLFGHTVGGVAGAVSRITGAMGKGVAALSFDKDYQRKRREAIQRRPANLHTGVAQSGKGLVMGVVDGVSGVFTKPISGAREQGVEGFFKGVGKGVLGLITRPTGGLIDFASGTLDQVKRVVDPSAEVTQLRPARFMHPDAQVRPYDSYEAEGNKLLRELEKGRYNTTDVYAYHVHIVAGNKDVLLLTDKRVMYIVHNEVFGGWQVDWEYTWDTLAAPPIVVERGVFVTTGEPRKKVLGLFGTAEKGGKIILIKDKPQAEYLVNKMKAIMNNLGNVQFQLSFQKSEHGQT